MTRSRAHRQPAWPFAVNWQSPQAAGLIGWWPMAPAGGRTLHDVGRGLTPGTIAGGASWTPDTLHGAGHALTFDGVNGTYVTCGDAASADFGTANFTVSFWVNVNAGASRALVLKDAYATGTDNGIFFFRDSGSRFGYWNGSATTVMVSSPTNGQWYHLVGVRTGTGANQLLLYVNGIQVATATESRTLSNSKNLTFGGDSTGLSVMTGSLRDIRICNIALPPALVWQMFDARTRHDLYRPLGRRQRPSAFLPLRDLGRPASSAADQGLSAAAATGPGLPGSIATQLNLTGSF